MKFRKPAVEHAELLEWLHYNPKTGIFLWLQSNSHHKAGARAGRLHHSGYRDIQFRGYRTNESRWAVFYMTGKWPEEHVDHRQVGKEYRSDNRWSEIRTATRSQNFANRRVQSNSQSGVKGVKQLPSGKWGARIGSKPMTYLGTFDTWEEAEQAVAIEAQKRYGEFARMH